MELNLTSGSSVQGFDRAEVPPDVHCPWEVSVRGEGAPVVILHELLGVTPEDVAFATRVADAGFKVWLPTLAGRAPSATLGRQAQSAVSICLSREISLFATKKTSPMALELRSLTAYVATVSEASGAGVIGMCFSEVISARSA
jgi:dienelactone hydrolase